MIQRRGYNTNPAPTVPIEPPEWTLAALCAQIDPDLWFPEKGDRTAGVRAKQLCQGCPSRLPCLAYALENREPYGVWGGLSERERRGLRKAS